MAFHTHHTVAALHSRKVSVAQPNIRPKSRFESDRFSLIISSGIRATKSVKPVMLSHPAERSTTESKTSSSRCSVEFCFISVANIRKRYEYSSFVTFE